MRHRPNVLVFVTHDTGRHLGCYGIDEVASPNIDRIANEGVRFDRFFATAALCSPSRAAMFSGLHPQTNGVIDHGIPFPRAKTTLYDPGIGTALLMRWPAGGISGGRASDQLLSNLDLTPTLLDLAGIGCPGDLHGRSFARACADGEAGPTREAVFAEHTHPSAHSDTRCIRTDRWKLIRNFSPSRLIPVPLDLAQGKDFNSSSNIETPVVELYDLERDPLETRNLSDEPTHADTGRELSRHLLEHLESVGDPILQGPVRWPYYETAMADLRRSAIEAEANTGSGGL